MSSDTPEPPCCCRCPATWPSSWMATDAGRARAAACAPMATAPASSRCAWSLRSACGTQIGALTLFAFSSENWGRPRDEVMSLMALFVESLEAEIEELHRRGVRVRFIGERAELDARLRASMASSEQVTAGNSRLALQIAVSYGGRSDIVGAARRLRRTGRAPSAGRLADRRGRLRSGAGAGRHGRIRTCSSAPAVSSASAISCCGTWPIPSSTSPTDCGRTSTRRRSRRPCSTTLHASGASG